VLYGAVVAAQMSELPNLAAAPVQAVAGFGVATAGSAAFLSVSSSSFAPAMLRRVSGEAPSTGSGR